jgi:ligand-binding SRPBCC domain-containing protein
MRYVHESRFAGVPPITLFTLHEEPGALERLIPPWEKVELVSSDRSLQVGSRVVMKMKSGPIPMRWVAQHVTYDPPHEFADIQLSGPFALWNHRHLFLDDGEGGTILRDEIDYEIPFGWIGRLLAGPWVERKLQKMFDYRHEATRRWLHERFPSGNA